jgi:nucleotide-binding universal stress UspA family protein
VFAKILHANDGSEGAFKALGVALDLAALCQAELHMICVEEMPHLPTTIDEVVEQEDEEKRRFAPVIERARKLASLRGVSFAVHEVAGHPVRKIVETVEQQRFDLLVVGFHGHAAIYERLIGGTADRLVRMASAAVLVVK